MATATTDIHDFARAMRAGVAQLESRRLAGELVEFHGRLVTRAEREWGRAELAAGRVVNFTNCPVEDRS